MVFPPAVFLMSQFYIIAEWFMNCMSRIVAVGGKIIEKEQRYISKPQKWQQHFGKCIVLTRGNCRFSECNQLSQSSSFAWKLAFLRGCLCVRNASFRDLFMRCGGVRNNLVGDQEASDPQSLLPVGGPVAWSRAVKKWQRRRRKCFVFVLENEWNDMH